MSEAQLIFSSSWLRDLVRYTQHLDDFQFAMVDKMAERKSNVFVITTTWDMDTGIRNHWTVETDYDNSELFYKHLMNDCPGSLEVYEDSDGVIYARYEENGRSSIWKFHFLQDLEFLIDTFVTTVGSNLFEDFRDTFEYTLQDGEYLSYNEEISVELIDLGNLEGEFSISLPYMHDAIVHGILYYDNSTAAWMVEDGSVSFDDAFDLYIDECLY